MQKKDYFNIPNIMGYFRILMIPVFIVFYLRADSQAEYYMALGALCLSLITDFLDGRIARKYNMVTSFGKVLDPIADKLTQLAIAAVLVFRYPFMLWFLVAFVLYQIYMGIMGLYLLKRNILYGAKWYGKVTTATIDLGCVAILLLRNMPVHAAQIINGVMIAVTLFALVKYIRLHWTVIKG
ncbi:MAG: CDP-alcohol phosphatidyltransferase family protein [Lachnospiraceae bacterium]|nr:CDP-alcohol phosphatidyltransferase family protein [Lachnospiraceae bacterium]MDD3614591.1 CDP-alcohol phosphatidyltransferase family protein [Lachnospiraceae bacterium]